MGAIGLEVEREGGWQGLSGCKCREAARKFKGAGGSARVTERAGGHSVGHLWT